MNTTKRQDTAKKIKAKILFAGWGCNNKKWHTYQLWDGPLREFFQKVITFDPQEEIYTNGKDVMNSKFIDLIKKEKPDYLFLWIMHEEFYFETLDAINKISPKTIVMCYNGDDDYKFENHTIHFFPFIDYYLCTQPDYLKEYDKIGKKAFYSCGFDENEFEPLKLKNRYDVSFVGTPKNDRVEYMKYLMENGVSIAVFGAGWEKYPEFKEAHKGEIALEDFVKVINESKINMCLSKNYFGGTHILERFFEINACKSFQLTEHAKGYFPLFQEGENIVTFKDKDELLEKVRYYLENEKERDIIAKNAYDKTVKSFSNQKLFKKAIEYMQKHGKQELRLNTKYNKIKYLNIDDLNKSQDEINNIIGDSNYICFKQKGFERTKYADFFQSNAIEMTGKPISVGDLIYNSRLIGDFGSTALHYAYDLQNKSYFYSNLNLSQIMIRKDYFLENIEKFRNFKHDKSFITKEDATFITLSLIRTKKVGKIYNGDTEYIFMSYFESELQRMRNEGKTWNSSHIYRLLLYSLFVNRDLLRFILKTTARKSKNTKIMRIAEFLRKIF